MTITRALVLDLNQHNQAIARARADYEAERPTTCSWRGYRCRKALGSDVYYCDLHRGAVDGRAA